MTASLKYDHGPAKEHCLKIGLMWDEAGAKLADQVSAAAGLTQSQFTEALKLHAERVKHLFTPANYPWKARLFLAAYFLGIAWPK
jgi:hypothetical protein